MKSTFSKNLLQLVTLSLILSGNTISNAQETMESKIDKLFAPWCDLQKPGAAIAVVKDGKVVFKKGYGCANLEYDIPVTTSTVFHIASVSKQVTDYAVLILEKQGKLSLDDDIRKYIPEVPDLGKKITLRQLANHTSGLRDQWTLLSMAGWRLDDVITKEHILKLVSMQKELNFEPGSQHMYSNTGYTLLAEVVARVSGQSFPDFTRDQIFKPLHMDNTLFYDDHEKIVKNRAYSYYFDGTGYKKSNLNYANAGATSLFTTVEDLALWAMNLEKPVIGDWEMIRKMNDRCILNNGDTITYALGQDIGKYKGLRFISHGGADAGYRSFIGRFPDQHLSVIVFSNLAEFNTADLALKTADLYLKDYIKEDKTADPKPLQASYTEFKGDPEILKTYCGKYKFPTGLVADITISDDKLYVEAHELSKRPMTQLTAVDFTVPGIDAKVTFITENKGLINHMSVAMNGQSMTADRMQEIDPRTIDLSDYAGSYYSPELQTTYTFAVYKGQLLVKHQRLSDFHLNMETKDQFSGERWFFSNVLFVRNAENKITGCKVSSGRVRDLRFEKVE